MSLKNKERITDMVSRNSVPNILFFGPYLGGKEILCGELITAIYRTKEIIKKYVLEINCIATNGIKTIKEDIKLFAKQVFHINHEITFKTIVLMYSENLTYESQYSLRRTIEQYNKSCRFILVCENKNQLLSPICSRFAHFYVNDNQYKSIYKNVDKFNYGKFAIVFKQYFSKIEDNSLTLRDIPIMSRTLYENNYYAYEVLNKFKTNQNYTNVSLLFDNINTAFKSELLSIFYLLLIFRNNSKIQIYDYY